MVRIAEAEAESKRLQGLGLAYQRKEIAKGIRESIETIKETGVDESEVMTLLLVTQHYDAVQDVARSSRTNTVMLDVSKSMFLPDVTKVFVDQDQGVVKWGVAQKSILDFVNDTNSAGINLALQFFPLALGSCDGSVYDTPSVPMGRLPEHAEEKLRAIPLAAAARIQTVMPTSPI